MRDELDKLYAQATGARDLAHKAYEKALRRNVEPGDTQHAWDTLMATNSVMATIRDLQIQAVTTR